VYFRDRSKLISALVQPRYSTRRSPTIVRAASGLYDPHATAVALATMNIHSLLAIQPGASDTDLDALVDTLATIWERTILPTTPPA